MTDARGNPLFFILTGGEHNDITQAEHLTIGFICECDNVLADRGYDSDDFVQGILDRGAIPVIPPRKNRTVQRDYDKHLYKERHLVECFIGKIKHFRRVFSRSEKLVARFLSFLSLATALIWLR